MQVALPAAAAKCPFGQAAQEPEPEDENDPGEQGVQDDEPLELKLPAAQVRHALRDVAPLTALALPAGHARHDELPCPGTGLYDPAAQGVQSRLEVAPKASKKSPSPHWVQLLDPVPSA